MYRGDWDEDGDVCRCGHYENHHDEHGCQDCDCLRFRMPRLSRHEKRQRLADSGVDTLEEYRGEK